MTFPQGPPQCIERPHTHKLSIGLSVRRSSIQNRRPHYCIHSADEVSLPTPPTRLPLDLVSGSCLPLPNQPSESHASTKHTLRQRFTVSDCMRVCAAEHTTGRRIATARTAPHPSAVSRASRLLTPSPPRLSLDLCSGQSGEKRRRTMIVLDGEKVKKWGRPSALLLSHWKSPQTPLRWHRHRDASVGTSTTVPLTSSGCSTLPATPPVVEL